MSSKFNLVEALESNGFVHSCDRTATDDINGTEYVTKRYTRRFEKVAQVAWEGEQVISLTAVVDVLFKNGKQELATAIYDFGKVKQHMPDKRAFNAIRDTVKFAGFEF